MTKMFRYKLRNLIEKEKEKLIWDRLCSNTPLNSKVFNLSNNPPIILDSNGVVHASVATDALDPENIKFGWLYLNYSDKTGILDYNKMRESKLNLNQDIIQALWHSRYVAWLFETEQADFLFDD